MTGVLPRLPKITLLRIVSRQPRYDIPHSPQSSQPREVVWNGRSIVSNSLTLTDGSGRATDGELDRDHRQFRPGPARAGLLAGEARPGSPRASCLGDVRLGQLGDGVH